MLTCFSLHVLEGSQWDTTSSSMLLRNKKKSSCGSNSYVYQHIPQFDSSQSSAQRGSPVKQIWFFCVCTQPVFREKSKCGRPLAWSPAQTVIFKNKNWENFWPSTFGQQLLHTAPRSQSDTKVSFFSYLLLWLTALQPLTLDSHLILPPALKQGTSWHLLLLPPVLLVLHSFRNIGAPCGFGRPALFVPSSTFSRAHTDPGGYPKLCDRASSMAFINQDSTSIVQEWWMCKAKSWLMWSPADYTAGEILSFQHPEAEHILLLSSL